MSEYAAHIGIRDVARVARLSTTTVSHALNGKGRVSEATREKVRRIADELGYKANISARHLSHGRTGLVGLRVAECQAFPQACTDFEYFSQLMTGASLAALSYGYTLALVPSGGDPTEWSGVSLDGAIVVDPTASDPLVAALTGRQVPVVTTGRDIESPPDQGYWVDNDHRVGTPQVLSHLAEQGAQRPALITTPPVHSYTHDICQAYEKWMSERGIEPSIAVVRSNPTEEGGFHAANALLDGDSPPDAIHATFDRIAIGALLAAQARSLRVPEDLLISGSTDSRAGRNATPGLTAVSFEPERVGHIAAAMLITLIEKRPVEERHVLIPTRLIRRGSTLRHRTSLIKAFDVGTGSPIETRRVDE